MSARLETKQGGEFETGFWGPDTSRIMMGDLPPIAIQEFSIFATDTVLQFANELEEADYTRCKERIQQVAAKVRDLPVRRQTAGVSEFEPFTDLAERLYNTNDEIERAELAAASAAAFSNDQGRLSCNYPANPFEYKDGYVSVGGLYEIDRLDFFYLLTNVLHGGMFGWMPELGAVAPVHEALERLTNEF